jgi:hypothetical protein
MKRQNKHQCHSDVAPILELTELKITMTNML